MAAKPVTYRTAGNNLPGTLVEIVQNDLREDFNSTDCGCGMQLTGDQVGNHHRIQRAHDPPRDTLENAAQVRFPIRLFVRLGFAVISHNETLK